MLYQYDCIILDINLPDNSGFSILETLHEQQKSDGVLILSARDSLDDKLKGLGLGADDYLTKPFYYSELNARIKAIVRRKQFKTSKEVRFSNIQINLDQRLVAVSENQVNQIGRASCRERECQYVTIWVVHVTDKKKKE